MYGGVGGVHTLMFVDLYQINAYIGSDIALVRFFIFSTDSPLKHFNVKLYVVVLDNKRVVTGSC